MSVSISPFSPLTSFAKNEVGVWNKNSTTHFSFSIVSQGKSKPKRDGGNQRKVWRRRKLDSSPVNAVLDVNNTKIDPYLEAKLERVPFLEEQVRKMNEGGGLLSGDIDRLMKSQENRFEFVNEVAAEAVSYVEKDRDAYGFKKPILHVLSNRMNEAGFTRSEAYLETDPFLPGPSYLREEERQVWKY